MVCKVNTIFDKLFEIYAQIKKLFPRLFKDYIKKMSAVNNLRKTEFP